MQHPPPRHAVPDAQQGSPTPPHATHVVPLQSVSGVLQSTPLLTHLSSAPSQQPLMHALPAQHSPPLEPHEVQAPAAQTV